MKNYAIGHFDDIDGTVGHIILERASLRSDIPIAHVDIDYGKMATALKKVDLKEGDRVRIFDVGYNPTWESPEFLKELARIAEQGDIEIYDHHIWPSVTQVEKHTKRIIVPREGDSLKRYCASEILNFFFGNGDDVSDFLSRVANKSDFVDESPHGWLRDYTSSLEKVIKASDKKITNLSIDDIIKFFTNLESIPTTNGHYNCSHPTLWSPQFETAKTDYKHALKDSKNNLEQNVTHHSINNHAVTIGFSKQILHMKEGPAHLKETFPNRDIYACIFPDRSIIFFRGTTKVNVGTLAGSFGGGGRESGAGAFIPKEHFKDQDTTRVYVLDKLESALS